MIYGHGIIWIDTCRDIKEQCDEPYTQQTTAAATSSCNHTQKIMNENSIHDCEENSIHDSEQTLMDLQTPCKRSKLHKQMNTIEKKAKAE
jgi:hypothetical protein